MKNRFLVIVSGIAVALLASARAQGAQNSASVSSNATARIVTAISISKTTDLDFGDVVPGASAGTVRITPAGVRSNTGGTRLGNGAAARAASFQVAGQTNSRFTITLPASVNVVTGANTMVVNTFRSTPTSPGNLGATGSRALTVGATLRVGASQPFGVYTGTFNVTVAYN